MDKLVVIFPGAGYGIDCPLLYYADFLFESRGYERKYIDYQSIVLNKELSVDEKKTQVRNFVKTKTKEIDFRKYEEVVFLSKSIGAIEAGWLADELEIEVKQIFLTPVRDALLYVGSGNKVVIGTCDREFEFVKKCCDDRDVQVLYIEGVNHSLEIEDEPFESMEVLRKVVEFIGR